MNTYFQREYGRALRGNKVEDTKRGRKFERSNVIGAFCNKEYFAIKCYNHTTNSEFFEQWFAECFLKVIPKGYTAIMDNASFHRKSKLYELAEEAGVGLLFLPPYSPDFNPIEKSWANMKRWLRSGMSDYPSIDKAVYDYFAVANY
jgi:transposase